MTAADVLGQVLHEYALVNSRINKLIEPWDDARLADQPHGQVNHPAWTVGHLCTVMDRGCMLAGGQCILDESWGKLYGGGSKPVSDRGVYSSKEILLNQFNTLCKRVVEQLHDSPAAMLTTENPLERARTRFPQTGQMIVHMLTAEPGYHLGQLSGWARAMGYPIKF